MDRIVSSTRRLCWLACLLGGITCLLGAIGCLRGAIAFTPGAEAAITTPRAESPSAPRSHGARLVDGNGERGPLLPLVFEANRGQVAARTEYLGRVRGRAVLFSSEGVRVVLPGGSGTARQPAAIDMKFPGRSGKGKVLGELPLPGRSNYLIGRDSGGWITDIPQFGRLRYPRIYPGIDLVFYGNPSALEYDFVVAPGRDPTRIRLRISGAVPSIDSAGNLVLHTPAGEFVQASPRAYQLLASGTEPVAARFDIDERGDVRFALGAFDSSRELRIDPVLGFSTYLGGSANTPDVERAWDLDVDALDNVYVTGDTTNIDFPTTLGAFQEAYAGGMRDVFVSKLSADGKTLLYSTFLGGIMGVNNQDIAGGIAVGSDGSAYVTGQTNSTDFPIVNGAQSLLQGSSDCFVAKLNPQGSGLVYATFDGGTGADWCNDIAVDRSGIAYVVGGTTSFNLPGAGGIRVQNAGGTDAFLSVLDPSGQSFLFPTTYLGGPAYDEATGVAFLESAKRVYMTGVTHSKGVNAVTPFPTTAGAFDPFGNIVGGNDSDAFVSIIDTGLPNGTSNLFYSTYLGGNGIENQTGLSAGQLGKGGAIAVDSSGDAYVTGDTAALDFPTTAGAYQATHPMAPAGGLTGFVTKLHPGGQSTTDLVWSTFLGGTAGTHLNAIAVDSAGLTSVAGETFSTDYPLQNAIQTTYGGGTADSGDGVFTQLDASGSAPLFSTYLGGAKGDLINGLVLDPPCISPCVPIVAGMTESSDFPTTAGAYDRTSVGTIDPYMPAWDAFVSRLGAMPVPEPSSDCLGALALLCLAAIRFARPHEFTRPHKRIQA